MSRRLGVLLVVLLGSIAHAQPNENADIVTIRAKQNDSFAMLASEYYGDRNKVAFLFAENKALKPKPLQPGYRIRIPVLREITTSPGDTFLTLAETFLGDHRRGGFLADANGMNPDDSLAAGTVLIVPFTITHTVEVKETLAAIAATYYNDPKLAGALESYNFLDRTTLEKGEAITIPSINVKVHPSKVPPPDAESKVRRERRRENAKLAAVAIPVARHAWKIGDYATAKKTLVDIDVAYVEAGPAIEVGLLLGSALVAFGETDAALAAFVRVRDRKPGLTLRKVDYSPKILAVWTKADGQVE